MSLRNAATARMRKSRLPQRVYHQVLWQLYRDQPVYTTAIDDRALRFATPDRYATTWFFSLLRRGGLHEPPVTTAMADAAKVAHVFADVGSHLGYYACVVAAAAPECEVIAFEMNDALIPAIKENLALNGRPAAEVVHAAVGAESGTATYERVVDPGLKASFGGGGTTGEPPASVPVITLDDFFADRQLPDLLKIDVEGAEGAVLRGAKRLLHEARPTLFLEVHPQSLPAFGSSIEEVLDTVRGAGYSLQAFTAHRAVGDGLQPVTSTGDVEENGMLLCTPSA